MQLPVSVVDDFLDPKDAAALLAFALEKRDHFTPSAVHEETSGPPAPLDRRSLSLDADPGAALDAFHFAVDARFDTLRYATGVPEFTEIEREVDLVAHLDGHHYKSHVDTLSREARAQTSADRMISMVYYFHREPRAFSGGELVIYPIAGKGERVIEPRHNRLVAFPSITPHEVRAIHLESDDFADARFSIACWLCRARR
ncbi:MAG: 2OG-Fe(II) oxygenase [Pseudomonadota bacterium]